jgi:hypothetical protein
MIMPLNPCKLLSGWDLHGGSIPPGGWLFPERLRWLDLTNTGLGGTLPETWALPSTLQVMYYR